MKLIDMINNVDKSERNEDTSICWNLELFCNELNYSANNWSLRQPDDNIRLTCYWAANHYCTDTYVGIRLYFLDDKFVALSTQTTRKSDEILEWKDKISADNVLSYIRSIDHPDEIQDVSELDLEEELGDGYPINYVGQLLVKEVLYKGDIVTVIKDHPERSDCHTNFRNIVIRTSSGEEKTIDVRDILVPWYVKK